LTNKEQRSAPALRLGAEHDIAFTDLLANGQAVGRVSGAVVFCFGPLPGEQARVRIATVKPKYSTAELVGLIAPSPNRATPFCEVFGTCGGCQLQHLNYKAQLEWKTTVVRNALQRIGGLSDAVVRNCVGMNDPRAYRNKMSLVVDNSKGAPLVGFYQQRSHDLVPIESCPIVTNQLNEYIGRFSNLRTSPEAAEMMRVARHVVARNARASGEAVVTITTAAASPEVERAAPAMMSMLRGAVGITNSYELSSQNAIVGRRQRVLQGRSEIEETIEGVRYRVSAGSFFQVNVEILQKIFSFLRNGLEHPRRIVDLYCGAGTFSLFFAKHSCQVYGVEENPQAVIEADGNATLNGLEHWVRFRAGRVEDVVRSPEAREAMHASDIIFLDPPRKGSDEVTLGAIAASGAPFIWYLSCDPATLARDLKFLVANGYRLGIVQPFDMFPHTGHVETLVTLYREAKAETELVADAFANAPTPEWPKIDDYATDQREYPDFVS
jgi:23S rRNA (uracil1939-C5)-methyltransferase